MRKTSTALLTAALLGTTTIAHAAPALRVQVTQHGDFLLIGNTLGYECATGTPAPVVGTIANGACNQGTNNVNDSSPDLFWQADAPANGQATASTAVTAATARSTAVLAIPAGATITHAFLYWGAMGTNNVADTQVTLERVGAGGFNEVVNATQSFLPNVNNTYQSVADVTAAVRNAGSGAYRVSGIDASAFPNVNNNNVFGGWSMVVLYRRPGDPLRSLALFDGLDVVSNGNNQSATLSGFRVPNANFSGKLGVIAYEGDNTINGDQLLFNGTALSNGQNPVNNVFNGTRSFLGAAVSVAGDLPQLTGTAQSMAGMDLDVFDVTSLLSPGQTSASIVASSTGDTYYLGAFVTSVSTFTPELSTSTKTVTDIDGPPTLSGDVLEYTITLKNSGNDASVGTVLTDVLPAGVTYVPNSLEAPGNKTDQAGDDEADYNAATRTVTVRLGAGANATSGGSIAVDGTATVSFRVRIDAAFTGTLSNQATIAAAGQLGAPAATTQTDGDLASPGAAPTTIFVDQCASNANCAAPAPVCASDRSPAVCVQCLADSDCGGPTSGLVCNTAESTCQPGCRGTGGNGCPAELHCSSTDATIGACDKCLTDAHCMNPTPVCSATNECAPCAADTDCTGKAAGEVCALQGALAGSCTQCTAANTSACVGATPACDAETGRCVACIADSDCTDPAKKRCDTAAHTCVSCLGKECEDAGAPDAGKPDAGGTPDASIVDEGTPNADGGVDEGEVGAVVATGCGCRTTSSNDVGGGATALGGLALALAVAGARRASRSKQTGRRL